MNKIWHDTAWNDYIDWQLKDKKTLRKINALIKDIERNGLNCTGKPEKVTYSHHFIEVGASCSISPLG